MRRLRAPLLLLVLAAAALVFWWAVDPATSRFMPQCPFRLLTGWQCPACGLQRAAHALLHGHPLQALRFNFFFLISLPFAAGACVATWWPAERVRRRAARFFLAPAAIWTYVVLFMLWWVVRNVVGL